jgi:hypothetical protein
MKLELILIVMASIASSQIFESLGANIGGFLDVIPGPVDVFTVQARVAGGNDTTLMSGGTYQASYASAFQSNTDVNPTTNQGGSITEGDQGYVDDYDPKVILQLTLENATEFDISAGDIVALQASMRDDCSWYFRLDEPVFCLLGRADDAYAEGFETYGFFCLIDATTGDYDLDASCVSTTGESILTKNIIYHITPPNTKASVNSADDEPEYPNGLNYQDIDCNRDDQDADNSD